MGYKPSSSPPTEGSALNGIVKPVDPELVNDSLFFQITFASIIIIPKVE
jgi:hypothetical protein